jgi:hypothetical protein
MSHFRILSVDHYDPVSIGKKNRILYVIYGIIPTLFILAFNIGEFASISILPRLLISVPVLSLIYIFLLRKIRADINSVKTIGEIEITQSFLKKRIGDSTEEYYFQSIKELTLSKHLPATRLKESKSGYFSYILKIVFTDGREESLIVSDRSVDHNNKLSIAETVKTLKKIVHFDVQINI